MSANCLTDDITWRNRNKGEKLKEEKKKRGRGGSLTVTIDDVYNAGREAGFVD
jgi:hypothetical protein